MDWLVYVMFLASAVAGYSLGNISTAYLIGMAVARKDVRKYGSKSAGTTNVMRMLGTGLGIVTFLGDVLKGGIAALVGVVLAGEIGGVIAGVSAVVGHNWPVSLNFKGGKGIATTAGMLLVLFPIETSILFAVALVLIIVTRIVSIGSLLGVLMVTATVIVRNLTHLTHEIKALADNINLVSRMEGDLPARIAIYIGMGLVFILAYVSHRENIVRLLTGKERKLKFRKMPRLFRRSKADEHDTGAGKA
ncbi:MAG: glycerol-3-phosphate 1-O-acyltransferase PlsY [Bacillota bacterium]|nr:glycerol-3-phosphate 1-O-acyltransferase PlsY [Bacillota bacterium]